MVTAIGATGIAHNTSHAHFLREMCSATATIPTISIVPK